MGITEFLEKVLPDKDNYVLWISKHDSPVTWNAGFQSIQDMAKYATKIDRTTSTVYFAVGTFADNITTNPDTGKTKVQRLTHQASCFRSLCCDLDVGEGYPFPSQKAAAAALLKACRAISLPIPMLVSSGRGVHAYWAMQQVIKAPQWVKLSSMLRAALVSNGVEVDASKIHDPTMVLRPVGTHHKKDQDNWRVVKVVLDAPPCDGLELVKALAPFKGAAKQVPAAQKKASSVSSALEGGDPYDVEVLGKHCGQIGSLLANGGASDADGNAVREPLWRASLGIAKYATNPEQAIERLCGGHDDYDLDTNIQKMDGWNGGPTTCATFERLQPSICALCKFRGKVKSPAVLAHQAPEQVVKVAGGEVSVNLPRRYSVGKGGIYYTPAGADEAVLVAPYEMYVIARYTDQEENRQVAKIAVNFPIEGMRTIDVDVPVIAQGGSELVKALALKQVYITGDPRLIRAYLMTYLKELQQLTAIDVYYKHFGWQEDGSFVTGDRIVGGNEAASPHYDGPVRDYVDAVQERGSLDNWTKLTSLFAQPDAKYHGLVFLMMAGAPLMGGSGIASTMVNSYSRESGSGKTITARLGLSVWGKPSKLMRTINDTDNALYKHFGVLHSLGAYIDEVTTMDPERLRGFVFTLQEGRERDRVRQSADGFREKVTWAMPVFASSNRDLYELLGLRYSSEAERLRVLQFPFARLKCFKEGSPLGYNIVRALEKNHGVAGPLIAAEIQQMGGAEVVYDKAYKTFSNKYGVRFLGQERFYQAMMVIADAVGGIMSRLGLIQFDYQKCIRQGVAHVLDMREGDAFKDIIGIDLLGQFLTENADKIIHYRERHLSKRDARKHIVEPIPKIAVARTEVAVDKDNNVLSGRLLISRSSLRKWLAFAGADYRSLINGLKDENIRHVESHRATLWKGVPGGSATGQTYCLYIDLQSHSRLLEMCDDTTPAMPVGPQLVVDNT